MGKFENRDCMEGMAEYPDNYFDLAIVDPPYGKKPMRDDNGTYGIPNIRKFNSSDNRWDKKPKKDYWKQLFRVSKNQIVWGMNYFIDVLFPSNSIVVWDKFTGGNVFADCELAWTSFKSNLKKFSFQWNGMLQEDMKNKEHRIHPTQKPVALYKWLLQNYAKPDDLILDTHVGSASSLIACIELGFDYVGYELDPDYYKAATERIERFKAQGDLFRPEPIKKEIQKNLFDSPTVLRTVQKLN